MWRNAKRIIRKLEKILPVEEIYLRGSFVSRKRRPADVDFIILLRTEARQKKSKWSVDFVVCPFNDYGAEVVRDVDKWMRRKYWKKNFSMLQLKYSK